MTGWGEKEMKKQTERGRERERRGGGVGEGQREGQISIPRGRLARAAVLITSTRRPLYRLRYKYLMNPNRHT